MTLAAKTVQTVPVTMTEDGTIRIANTRVPLESVIHHFNLGATAEQIVHKFPALNLGDVYAVIAYYLANRQSADDYMHQQNAKAEAARTKVENEPDYQSWKADLRERLLAREKETV